MFLVSESVCGDSVSISMSYWILSVVEGCDKAGVTGVVVVDVTLSGHTHTWRIFKCLNYLFHMPDPVLPRSHSLNCTLHQYTLTQQFSFLTSKKFHGLGNPSELMTKWTYMFWRNIWLYGSREAFFFLRKSPAYSSRTMPSHILCVCFVLKVCGY